MQLQQDGIKKLSMMFWVRSRFKPKDPFEISIYLDLKTSTTDC